MYNDSKDLDIKEYNYLKKNALNKFHFMLVNLDNNIDEKPIIDNNIIINNSIQFNGFINYILNSYKYLDKTVQIYIFTENELIKFLFPIKIMNVDLLDTINNYLIYCFPRTKNINNIKYLNEFIDNLSINIDISDIYYY